MQIEAPGSDASITLQPKGWGTVLVPTVQTSVRTIASLPACNAGTEGMRAAISDALSPSPNATLAGGGTVHTGAYCNGTVWINL